MTVWTEEQLRAIEARGSSVLLSAAAGSGKTTVLVDRMVKMVFTDSGFPFDPTSRPRPRLTSTPGNRPVGGLGIHIVKKTMDKVKYDYLAGKNTLTIEKHI